MHFHVSTARALHMCVCIVSSAGNDAHLIPSTVVAIVFGSLKHVSIRSVGAQDQRQPSINISGEIEAAPIDGLKPQ